MLYEFAVEPTSLRDWRDLRYVLDQMGVHHGRLVAEYPSAWRRLVYESFSCYGGTQNMSRVEELVRRAKSAMVSRGRPYRPEQAWLDNAEAQQAGATPFHAILAESNPRNREDVLPVAGLHAGDPLWNVPREASVPRTAEAIARAAAPLIEISKAIILIDPYFSPGSADFVATLEAILEVVERARVNPRRLEVHASAHKTGTKEYWARMCNERLPSRVPAQMRLRIVRRRKRPGGEKFHARYILTERGGLRFDVGLDAGESGETTDVMLTEPGLWAKRWAEFCEEDENHRLPSMAFELVDELTIVGERGGTQPARGQSAVC